ncbi:MAG: hypothetical protein GX643_08795 [Acidimicrobiales bacterium]|nr:hypothetical protein [Acidimicrobiales bacterium]
MESPDLTNEEFTQALDQSWVSRSDTGSTALLTRMRDSLAAMDASDSRPKLSKEQFLAELAGERT